jgi:hypothetical protein
MTQLICLSECSVLAWKFVFYFILFPLPVTLIVDLFSLSIRQNCQGQY